MEQYSRTISALIKHLGNDKNTHGFNNLGIAYFEIGDYKYALKSFDEAIVYGTDNDVAFVNRGLLFEKSGDQLAAERDYTSAIEILPSNVTYWRSRAYLHKQQEQWQEALKDFLEAQKIEPSMERTNKEIEEIKSRLGGNS